MRPTLPILLVAAFASAPLSAQVTLSFEEVRAEAREANLDVQIAEARAREAEAQVRRAWAPLIPAVHLGVTGTRADREIALTLPEIPGFDVESPVFQHRERLDLSAGFETMLLEPSAFPRASAAEATVASRRAEREAAAERAEWIAIDLCYQLATLDGLGSVAQQQLDRRAAHLAAVEERFAVDLATVLEQSRAETAFVEAEGNRDDIAFARRQVLRALALVLDREPSFDVSPPSPPGIEQAGGDRAEQRVIGHAREAAHEAERAVDFSWLPDVVASGQWAWSSAEAIDGEHDSWNVAIGLRWTVLDHGLRGAERREVEARAARLLLESERLDARLASEEADALDTIAYAERRLRQAERRLETTTRAVADAERAYAYDVVTSVEVVDAETERAAAENAVVASRLELDRARWRLAWVRGTL